LVSYSLFPKAGGWFSDMHGPNVWWCGVGTYGDF